MKTYVFLIVVALSVSSFKEKPKSGIKNLTLEVKYNGINRWDTLFLKNARSPICIADFQNGETCLISGKDSVITCNVEDYKIISIDK